jgi:hypothetical protein
MRTKSIVTALALGFLALAVSVLPLTTASAQPLADRQVACESKGNKWNSETGRCIKSLKKAPPSTSGGIGGGSDAQFACESKSHQWNSEAGRCIKSLKGCPPGYSEYQGRCALYQDGKIIQFF